MKIELMWRSVAASIADQIAGAIGTYARDRLAGPPRPRRVSHSLDVTLLLGIVAPWGAWMARPGVPHDPRRPVALGRSDREANCVLALGHRLLALVFRLRRDLGGDDHAGRADPGLRQRHNDVGDDAALLGVRVRMRARVSRSCSVIAPRSTPLRTTTSGPPAFPVYFRVSTAFRPKDPYRLRARCGTARRVARLGEHPHPVAQAAPRI